MSAKDFERLCRSIDESVGQLSKIVGEGSKRAGAALEAAISQKVEEGRRKASRPAAGGPAWQQYPSAAPKRFLSSAGLTASGVAMVAVGGTGVLLFGIGALIVSLTPLLLVGPLWTVGVAASAVLAALSAVLLAFGIRRFTVAQRYKAFRRILANREACSFEELAGKIQISEAQAKSAAKRMLKYGLLPEGRIDDEGTCLMVSNQAYEQYLQAQIAYRQRLVDQRSAELARSRAKARGASEPLPKEAKALLDAGRDFLRQVRDLDVAIDDEAVSRKIVAIEQVVERILERVEDEPSVVASLDRLTDYYLPTTVKLLAAYDDLEDQPVQGDNIAGSRKEIEHTLDVLHLAFEKLLDDTYRDLSLDVSSDISVLHAVLAQEGLTESPFAGRTDPPGGRNASADSQ